MAEHEEKDKFFELDLINHSTESRTPITATEHINTETHLEVINGFSILKAIIILLLSTAAGFAYGRFHLGLGSLNDLSVPMWYGAGAGATILFIKVGIKNNKIKKLVTSFNAIRETIRKEILDNKQKASSDMA